VVEDLSTGAFLNVFRTFAALRGNPKTMYSDNGTNFVGAQKELKPVIESLSEEGEFQDELISRGVQWHRYPPHGPHWGGLHEALVKSAKRALRHALDVGQRRRYLREHELVTLYAEVTGFLNNRPLTYASSDPADGYLTPNHFLMPGRHHHAETPPNLQAAGPYRGSYEHVQWLTNEFWKVWLREYLPALTTRAKWQSISRNAAVNDLVLVLDHQMPRDHWRLGRVIQVFTGRNGRVRSCRLRTIRRKKFDGRAGKVVGLRGDTIIRQEDKVFIDRPVTQLVLLRAADQEPALLPPAQVPAVTDGEDV
jgi:hypothetical protein